MKLGTIITTLDADDIAELVRDSLTADGEHVIDVQVGLTEPQGPHRIVELQATGVVADANAIYNEQRREHKFTGCADLLVLVFTHLPAKLAEGTTIGKVGVLTEELSIQVELLLDDDSQTTIRKLVLKASES